MRSLLSLLEGIDNEEFRGKVRGNLFAEFEPFLPLLPEEYAVQLKRTKFSEVRAFLEKNAKEKAKIISEEKRWDYLEKGFEKLKKKI